MYIKMLIKHLKKMLNKYLKMLIKHFKNVNLAVMPWGKYDSYIR